MSRPNIKYVASQEHAEVLGLKFKEISRRPLDLLDKEGVREIYFFPLGVDSIDCSTIGDSMIASLGPAQDLRKTFPNARVNVVSPLTDIFRGEERIRAIRETVEGVLAKKGEGNLLIFQEADPGLVDAELSHSFDQFPEFKRSGGKILFINSSKTVLLGDGLDEGGDYLLFNIHPETRYGFGPFHRCLMRSLGCESAGLPRIHVSDEAADAAEEKLLRMGFRPRGSAMRVALSFDAYTNMDAIPTDEESKTLLKKLISDDADVLIDPAKGGATFNRLSGVLPKDPHIVLPSELGLRELITSMNQCDLVICPNTGVMWIAAALKKPTLAYTRSPYVSASYVPEGTDIMHFMKSEHSIMQGVDAFKLLRGGRPFEVFKDAESARGPSADYLRVLDGLDPAYDNTSDSIMVSANHRRGVLRQLLKPDFTEFFTTVPTITNDLVRCHLQDPLYRYLMNAFQAEREKTQQ